MYEETLTFPDLAKRLPGVRRTSASVVVVSLVESYYKSRYQLQWTRTARRY